MSTVVTAPFVYDKQESKEDKASVAKDISELRLVLSQLAHLKLQYLSHIGGTEVGFFGIASEHDLLFIEDLYVPKQKCTSASVDFLPEGLEDMQFYMAEKGIPASRYARVWIHTHPNGIGCTPSGTDEATFKDIFAKRPWSVMAIFSHSHGNYARIQYTQGPHVQSKIDVRTRSYSQLPHEIEKIIKSGEDLFGKWKKEYQDNVEEFKYTTFGVNSNDSDWYSSWSKDKKTWQRYPAPASYIHTGSYRGEDKPLNNPYQTVTLPEFKPKAESYTSALSSNQRHRLTNNDMVNLVFFSRVEPDMLINDLTTEWSEDHVTYYELLASNIESDVKDFEFTEDEHDTLNKTWAWTPERIRHVEIGNKRDNIIDALKLIYDADKFDYQWLVDYIYSSETEEVVNKDAELDYGTEKEKRKQQYEQKKKEEQEELSHLLGGDNNLVLSCAGDVSKNQSPRRKKKQKCRR